MNDLIDSWDDILEKFKKDINIHKVSFDTWIKPLEIATVDGNEVTIITPQSTIGVSYIEDRNYLTALEATINELLNSNYKLVLISSEDHINNRKKQRKADANKNRDTINLNPEYTFENFVVSSNNNLAYAASVAVAETPGRKFNPLFIYGGTGLGKTHLLQAIAHFIIENNPTLNVLYVTSETFTNELIESVKSKNNNAFREKYRTIDVLLIDDIQFIIGKESTQEEFFHTFNTLYQDNKQIIITSDKPPKEMETLADRLRTRFSEGLICDIQIPDYETKMAILNKKIENQGRDNIPTEVRDYIAKNIKSSIRELEGSINKLSAYADLTHSPITLDLAMDALKDLISSDHKKEVTPALIIDIVCEHFGISHEDITSNKRVASIAFPRQVCMYLCRILTDASYQEIGNKLGGKDHSTVIHGYEKIEKEVKDDDQKKNTIEILKRKINPS